MGRFCTACGAPARDEGAFCQQCGAQLAGAPGSTPHPAPARAPATAGSHRWRTPVVVVLIVGIIAVVLAVVLVKAQALPDDTGPYAVVPEKAIRGHWGGGNCEFWIADDEITLKYAGAWHNATYRIVGTEMHGDDFKVDIEADFGDDVFVWYDDLTIATRPLTGFRVDQGDRDIQFSLGDAWVGYDWVDAQEEP